jgi:4-hydroxy-3-methylbut-2-enyl diphosphate reductase
MRVIKAEHLGMCFGVRDAIALALRENAAAPLTILGDLVHNETVLADLRAQGVRLQSFDEDIATANVLITAHGASRRSVERLHRRGLNVLEATCPLVRFAHDAILQLAASGFHPVIIGQRDHVEVRGLTGDLDNFDVILDENDLAKLGEHPRLGVAAQTTQPQDKVEKLVAQIRERFPDSEVRFIDTVCRPTKQRQNAAVELARRCDVVIVIGGAQSNNTRELVATCRRYCLRVHHVQSAHDLRVEWFTDAQLAGLTAGTSTPDATVDEVEQWLKNFSAQALTKNPPQLETIL